MPGKLAYQATNATTRRLNPTAGTTRNEAVVATVATCCKSVVLVGCAKVAMSAWKTLRPRLIRIAWMMGWVTISNRGKGEGDEGTKLDIHGSEWLDKG